jgi:hypothetical protein
MKNQKRIWLEWFIKFLNMDLEHLPVGDQWKLAAEVSSLQHGSESFPEPGREPDQIRNGIADIIGPSLLQNVKLNDIQKRIRDFFEFMMNRVEPILSSPEDKWKPLEQMDFMPDLGSFRTKMTIRTGAGPLPLIQKERKVGSGRPKLFKFKVGELEQIPIKILFEAEPAQDILVFHFIRTLEGLPLGSIRRCQECDLWFVHFSKHEKLFCSNTCASRYGARRRRKEEKEKDPAAYQKLQEKKAELAHVYYKKKIPVGKPKRRPYKHKEL